MTGWLPKSRKARRRLVVLSAVAPVLALAVGLTLWGLSDSISYFYTPAQAAEAQPEPGRTIQLGGLVAGGSVVKHPDGRLEFVVADQIAMTPVTFQGDPPDLFREGQGVVATGAFREDGVFEARRLLADTRKPVKQIAAELGFASPAYFTRAFQGRCGQSPRSFRTGH